MTRIAYFGHHKSASTYLAGVLRQVSASLGLSMRTEFLSDRLPLGYEADPAQAERIRQMYGQLAGETVDIICHGNADNAVVRALRAAGPLRGFHVIRDPRDLMVSGYFWHISDRSVDPSARNGWNADRRTRLRAAGSQEQGLLMEVGFCACYFDAMAAWDYADPDILELRFEDLIEDPLAVLRQAMGFVGLDVPDLERIVADTAFRRLAEGRGRGQEARDHKYRKGVAGDWRNHFTPAVTAAFKERWGGLLVQLGYERDLGW